ncbi:hypothetical protein Tco_0968237 [Tanacetum coccineum]
MTIPTLSMLLESQALLIKTPESMQNFLKKYDHIPHNEKSIKLLLAEEKFLKIKQVVEEEQTQPEYLQALLQRHTGVADEKGLMCEAVMRRDCESIQFISLRYTRQGDVERKMLGGVCARDILQNIAGDGRVEADASTRTHEHIRWDCGERSIVIVNKEGGVLSFSDNSITRGIESDHDSGEDTTSIDDLPLDDSMILSEYESFTFDDEPVMAEVNAF